MTEFLTAEELLIITGNAIGGPPVVRDYGLLESAAARPRTSVFGEDAYPDLWVKAAALGHSLIGNHPLVDGNKRLGWVAMRVFLELNGEEPLRADVDEAEAFVLAIADGSLREVEEIAARLRGLRR
ncbi:death-on-curing protein [Allocatelliglobosispora scoriae]|uniref:Death-on-curing protein n=1 Tax=Allocatelliglobosispora scoriae TaxID=643052 RepID=A0A841BXE4_9ACTN|nr:type II toxin-antitoxin system death-on-curing family toxin [Allocatelliglobosispora scoriae]MBB5871432.1 death-on-curing protein [Allocatelliglobosispora scoriae]